MNAIHRDKPVRLGRPKVSPHVLGPRRLMAGRLLASLPPPAPSRDWLAKPLAEAGGNLGVMHNDTLGDCTCAAVGHAVQVWTANNAGIVTPPDSAVLGAYETVCGYNPSDPSTDQGGVEADVLAAWKRGIDGLNKLDGWIPVNPSNVDHLRKAVERFGIVYAGLSLPKTIQNQSTLWTVDIGAKEDAEAGSLGGHAVIVGAYDSTSFDIITWGYRVKMSLDFVASYMDEGYAPLCGPLWCPSGASPLGDSVPALTADLSAVA